MVAIHFWTISLPCIVIANVLLYWVSARLKSLGYERQRGFKMQNATLYLTYWRLAPKRGWSRLPLVTAVVLFGFAFVALFLPN